MEMGGTAACILNAANEISVEAFLQEKIQFLDIAEINEATMLEVQMVHNAEYEDFVKSDALARICAEKIVKELSKS
jgi:1-deoxy-D-xylulose-5-phosphate reductoisomerase